MQCPHEHLKTIVYAKFGGRAKCIMANSKIENDLTPRGNDRFGLVRHFEKNVETAQNDWKSVNRELLNRPFPSSRFPPLQRVFKYEVFVMVISSTLHMNENLFS